MLEKSEYISATEYCVLAFGTLNFFHCLTLLTVMHGFSMLISSKC